MTGLLVRPPSGPAARERSELTEAQVELERTAIRESDALAAEHGLTEHLTQVSNEQQRRVRAQQHSSDRTEKRSPVLLDNVSKTTGAKSPGCTRPGKED